MVKKNKGITAGHLTMMALGSVIGGSFFLGSSVAIHAAGPSILISYILGGVLVYLILYALSEMTVANPNVGSFSSYAAEQLGLERGLLLAGFIGQEPLFQFLFIIKEEIGLVGYY